MKIVTGMHRSGTSLVCQLLAESGVDFGDRSQFLEKDRWNTRGYFELRPVIDLNSRLITGIPRTTSRLHAVLSQCLYMTRPVEARINRRAERHAEDIHRLGTDYSGLTVKDPRFCLTLRAWMTHSKIERIVICLRHPEEVADSLKRRQRIPRGPALRFWAYHIHCLLKNAPMEKCCFFDVHRLAAGHGESELARVSEFMGVPLNRDTEACILDKIFHNELIRESGVGRRELPDEVRVLWEQINELAERQREPNTRNE